MIQVILLVIGYKVHLNAMSFAFMSPGWEQRRILGSTPSVIIVSIKVRGDHCSRL
jgi:hypothetical protein